MVHVFTPHPDGASGSWFLHRQQGQNSARCQDDFIYVLVHSSGMLLENTTIYNYAEGKLKGVVD